MVELKSSGTCLWVKCKHLSHNLPFTLESLRSYEIKTKAFPVSLFNSNTVTLNEKHVSLSAKRSLLNTSTGCHLCETYSRNVTGYCATVFSESTQSNIKSLLNKNLRTETMFSRQVKIWAGTLLKHHLFPFGKGCVIRVYPVSLRQKCGSKEGLRKCCV